MARFSSSTTFLPPFLSFFLLLPPPSDPCCAAWASSRSAGSLLLWCGCSTVDPGRFQPLDLWERSSRPWSPLSVRLRSSSFRLLSLLLLRLLVLDFLSLSSFSRLFLDDSSSASFSPLFDLLLGNGAELSALDLALAPTGAFSSLSDSSSLSSLSSGASSLTAVPAGNPTVACPVSALFGGSAGSAGARWPSGLADAAAEPAPTPKRLKALTCFKALTTKSVATNLEPGEPQIFRSSWERASVAEQAKHQESLSWGTAWRHLWHETCAIHKLKPKANTHNIEEIIFTFPPRRRSDNLWCTVYECKEYYPGKLCFLWINDQTAVTSRKEASP